jgi:ubiquinone/menaquinone biosynthesis C-methylase UbiE
MGAQGEMDEVRRTWQAVGPAWERHRDRMFENTRVTSDWLTEQVAPQPGQTVLELAAGPGETGFLFAERVLPGGRLISSDLAPAMVEAARRGGERRGLANVDYRVIDAQQIELPDDAVDVVVSRFGLMLVPEPDRAFAEIRRVLRPGGRLAYAVWGPPDGNHWIALLIGSLLQNGYFPPGDPSAPGGVFSLAAPERNRELLDGAGFPDVHTAEVGGAMHFENLDDYWSIQTSVAGPVADLVGAMQPDEVAAVKATLATMIEPFRSGDGYALPSLTTAVSAS